MERERIDYLWDAFDECLCKTELKAVFERLKTENDRLKTTPVAKLYLEGVADRVELATKLHQAQAENERLQGIIRNQSNLIENMGKRGAALQSHLDKISEPIKHADRDYVKRYSIPFLREYHHIQCAEALERILAYLDSQKPAEKRWRCYRHRLEDCTTYNAPSKECPHGFCVGYCPTCKAEKMLKDRK